uniref:Myosin motor domain-containing protein n=1 Tax=Strongyloides stercoralis TaxID=6248 RepID=A0A0K0EKS2_STRER
MSFDSISSTTGYSSSGIPLLSVFPRRALTIAAPDDTITHTRVTVYLHSFNPENSNDKISFDFHKRNTTEELIEKIIEANPELNGTNSEDYEIYETMGTLDGRTFKERRLDRGEYPIAVQMLWSCNNPNSENDSTVPRNRFVFRSKSSRPKRNVVNFVSVENCSTIDSFLAKFLSQPQDREYADLCMLPELTEQTLLDNLKDRFNSGHIYTYIGPILVAVNPFSFFPIYNPKYARLYCQSRRLGALPPHIFAIADITYHNMLRVKESQCVVISGESGSGKTESTNFLLHHLTTLSQKGSTAGTSIEQTLLSAGPVLEAFGNAVTVQNNNSSRFGKFIKVNYRENGMISGANVEIYLLEKSRIISQAIGERNYHVFYYLLDGTNEDEKKNLYLLSPKNYYYLNQNNFFECDTINGKNEFYRLKKSMEAVGFSLAQQQKIWSVLSSVLLLGNIKFIKRSSYHSDENAYIENEEILTIITELLDLKDKQLLEALTMRRTMLRNETVITRYNIEEAINTRDAMAKCLYNALFHWIVLRMNQALVKKEATLGKKGFYIGILDIFGFEDIGGQLNSFEQLCINYANEHLQAYFNQHIFQFEQEEYLKEGITWTNIEYTDNTECVHLFQSKPYGILRLIDEESNINNGTNASMLEKLNTFLKNNEYYEIPHKKEDAFIVAHYAGKVKYQITGFREKNKDLMRLYVVMVFKNSKSSFVRELLGDDPVAIYRWSLVKNTFRAVNAFKQSLKLPKRAESVDHLIISNDEQKKDHLRRSSDSTLNQFLRGDLPSEIVPDFCDTSVFKTIVNKARKQCAKPKVERLSNLKSLQAVKELYGRKPISTKPISVSKQFEYSLNRLMKTLAKATPYFIRCIKSNNDKIPNYFDDNIILRQLRYTGMLETVRIRRAGYSVRIEYEAFVNQYRILLPKGLNTNKKEIIEFLSNHSSIDGSMIQFGHTKIFMRDAEKLLLDDHLHRTIMSHIVTLQRWFRACSERRRFLKMRSEIVSFQAACRAALAKKRLNKKVHAATVIQSHWKGYLEHKKYLQIRKAVIELQSVARKKAADRDRPKLITDDRTKRKGTSSTSTINKFEIGTIIKKIDLPTFNLNNPSSLSQFADQNSSSESSSNDSDVFISTEEEISEVEIDDDEVVSATFSICNDGDEVKLEEKIDKDGIDLECTFVLEDTKLKLIEEDPNEAAHFIRRQSIATTSSTAKLKTLRRAASTESDQIPRIESGKTKNDIPVKDKAKSRKMNFIRAKKHLKALLTRKTNDLPITLSDDESCEADVPSNTPTEHNKTVSIKPKHSFKMSRLHISENCSYCHKAMSGLLVQACKCSHCKLSFHKECVQYADKMVCFSNKINEQLMIKNNKHDEHHKSPRGSLSPLSPIVVSPSSNQKTFNLTKTKQQTDPSHLVIQSLEDLRLFSVFIFKKQYGLDQHKKRDTVIDAIFKQSLREFHMELIGYEAVLQEDGNVLKYHNMITTFDGLLTKVSNREGVSFPTTLGVNAFRGFLNEFIQEQDKRRSVSKKSGIIKSVRKKRRKSDITIHNGHRFRLELVHVPTYCEICNQFMWHSEKVFICELCRLSCHKKCHVKVVNMCSKFNRNGTLGHHFFGTSLNYLMDDSETIPTVLNSLLMNIEVRALFVEGLYRKTGSLATVRATRKQIETCEDYEKLNFDEVPVHVVTTLVKAFFRELIEPLITFELYENFINVSEVEDSMERVRCLSVMTDLLPKCNKCVLDRLMYHLARVAYQETVNKMSASNLALIFAPCILRRQQAVHAQEQLQDVHKQAICVQTLIEEKLKQYKATLTQIVEIEQATEKVSENLRKIDEHRRMSECIISGKMSTIKEEHNHDFVKSEPVLKTSSSTNMEAARQLFVEQLSFLDKEKEKLISELPPMAPVASSEDLSSAEEHSLSPQELSREEYAIDFDNPPVYSILKSVNKNRPKRVGIRLPQKYKDIVEEYRKNELENKRQKNLIKEKLASDVKQASVIFF